jgi:hypothetical protein
MRTLAIAGACVLGVILIMVVTGVAAGNGRDHSGEQVRANKWADDVCGTVGAWQGQLKAVRDELRHNNWAARRSDGYTGDAQEEFVTIHGAVDSMISATQETLQEGLKRAGIPDTSNGAGAAAILRDWANRTELRLRVAKGHIKQKPTSVSEAFASLAFPVAALATSAVDGRVAFKKAAALDSEVGAALTSRKCGRLLGKQP